MGGAPVPSASETAASVGETIAHRQRGVPPLASLRHRLTPWHGVRGEERRINIILQMDFSRWTGSLVAMGAIGLA